ncbi:alpha/beta hydrolase [Lutibacter sp. HS1-25]|uniref:alpha/beta hydrolase n=1 Tax=Lutibacter sp. HS1-25 TaxID=2485000 RepID=UPI0010125F18|nr:alpha/beta hydrolase [Lutibacter sp. HS1-25]RXP46878.1 alpha/beta hydrolase [Lutibacter sp. HS1-25]
MKVLKLKTIKKYIFICLVFLTANSNMLAQNETINLWSSIPDEIINTNYKKIEVFKNGVLYSTSKVSTPTLTVFFPDKENSTGTAVVICPGGGYSHLAIDKEGFKVAKWFNSLGIAAFVLKYRLPSDSIMKNKAVGPLQDAQEAIRVVRRNAKKWNINNDKIGVMGFSAGGHLAATLSTHYNEVVYKVSDETSAKPNFSILIYPVISMLNEVTHNGSKINLLGKSPSDLLIEKFSNELQVNTETPPTFLIHATDDGAVPVENSINYYLQLKKNKVSAELHVYQKGGHGFGLGVNNTSQYWTSDCENWLRENNY